MPELMNAPSEASEGYKFLLSVYEFPGLTIFPGFLGLSMMLQKEAITVKFLPYKPSRSSMGEICL
jgi:hypothetical protein